MAWSRRLPAVKCSLLWLAAPHPPVYCTVHCTLGIHVGPSVHCTVHPGNTWALYSGIAHGHRHRLRPSVSPVQVRRLQLSCPQTFAQ